MLGRTALAATTLILTTALGACTTIGAASRLGTLKCRSSAGTALIGQMAPSDDRILKRTRSKTIRRLAPGDAATMDYREDRVSVTVAEGRIVAASCG